jgi:hypothetical protein
MPMAEPGKRVEIVPIEPIILLSVTRKGADVAAIDVRQPPYEPLWIARDASGVKRASHKRRRHSEPALRPSRGAAENCCLSCAI